MKTASKLLSMLLLVAMCLSLMGGSAYATGLAPLGEAATQGLAPLDLPASGTDEVSVTSPSGLAPLDLSGSTPSLLTGEELIWKVTGGSSHEKLSDALAEVGNGGTITLCADATISDPVSIAKSITLDLGGKKLTLSADVITAADVTLKNGEVVFTKNITAQSGVLKVYSITAENAGFVENTGDVQIYSGKFQNKPADSLLAKDRVWDTSTQEVVPVSDSYVAYVNGKGYPTVDAAFAAANDLGKKDIIIELNSGKLENLTLSGISLYNCNSLTLKLNDEHLVISGTLELGNYPTTITGYKIEGTVKAEATTLTLGSGLTATRIDALGGASVTVNGATVGTLSLTNAALNMATGSIDYLQIADDTTASPLNVSGGTVKGFDDLGSVLPVRAITGGEWTLDDADLAYFDGAVANNYERRGDASPYTVARIGSSGSGSGSGGVDNGFSYTLYGSPYTKYSTGTVYVDISALSTNGYWIGTKADATNAQQIASTNYEGPVANGTGYRLTFKNSYLNSLPNGTYYLFAVYGGNTVRMCSTTNPLVITGSDSITVNPGTAAVWPVDSSLWYSGDGTYYFYVTPALQLVDGTPYDYYEVRIDDVLLGGDKFTYNGYQKFGIATSVMDNLTVGTTHTLTVLTPAGYASCNFRIGATLRPVDTDKHVTGSSKNLQFVCSDAISRVWIGSNELTSLNYGDYWTLSSSGKTITLTAKLMNTQLVAGNTYTLTVQTANGDTPSCTFKILTTAQASASPQTGDESNLALWAAVLVLTGGAAVAILPRLKKHEN